nr:hypothetical protein [Tanacetum cinerariifolium]
MDVKRIEEEVDPDFLSGANSRTRPAESGDTCESKDVFWIVQWIVGFPFYLLFVDIVDTVWFTPRREVEFRIELVQGATPIVKARVVGAYEDERVVGIIARAARGARVAFEYEFGAAEEKEVSCEAQQGYVRTLIMKEAHATKDFVPPGTDGQSERTFRTLENMFRSCVRNLVVVGILTFREAEIGESKMIGIELEQETTKPKIVKRVKLIVEMKLLEFSVGDHVMMKVSPWKGEACFGKKCELAPRYIGPFEILERIGPVAYRLRFPDELSIGNYLSGVKISSKPEIALIF